MSAYRRRSPTRRTIVPITDSIDSIGVIGDPTRLSDKDTAYEITKSYRNYLSYPVVLIDRNNLVVALPAQKRRDMQTPRALIVDVRMSFHDDVRIDITHVLDRLRDNSPIELRMFKEALNKNRVSVSYGRRQITLSYKVEEHVLRRNEWQAHITELDMVICKEGLETGVVHPYSKEGQVALVSNQYSVAAFTYRVLINDPLNVFGERYINVNGFVYHVPATSDATIKPGVYVYPNEVTEEDVIFYNFDEADGLVPLYQTAKLAEQLGNPDEHTKQKASQFKAELLQKEHELNEQKARFAEQSLKRDAEHAERMHELRKLEAEYKRLEAEYKHLTSVEAQRLNEQKAKMDEEAAARQEEINRLKHEMDMRGYQRKDTSEWIKWIPAVISAVGALFALFR